MKKITAILYCILLFSCKSEQITLSPFVDVYKSKASGNIYPTYIILRTQPRTFETYVPGTYESVIGEWSIQNDTLFLLPRYEYYSRSSELRFSEITLEDSSVVTIPQQYLIKKNCLIDITNYNVLFRNDTLLNSLFSNLNNREVYRRVVK